ncbi:MAG: RAMP superfamily CRISPR-associated protein [Oscillospiraceae bacterium]|nr:RAMP superfamily CRISPR-associated protein [Oscillospiraceae bacterium]
MLINSGTDNKIDPTLTDMSFVRCIHNGARTVYLPGSSLKGVFRSRYEQLMRAFESPVCKLFSKESCSEALKNKKSFDGTQRYKASCAACRLFGNLSLGSRIAFADAYPDLSSPAPVLGRRHGVGINRITGAAAPGALFEMEVLESGVFDVEVRLTNFALYQLRLILWIVQDIDDGLVTFGMGGTRGNGQMRLKDSTEVQLRYRLFDDSDVNRLRGYDAKDVGGSEIQSFPRNLFGRESQLKGLEEILRALGLDDRETLRTAMRRESWENVLACQRKRNA